MKKMLLIIIWLLSILFITGCSIEISVKKDDNQIQNNLKTFESKSNEIRNDLIGEWELYKEFNDTNYMIDKKIVINEKNILFGTFGVYCFDDEKNRISDCEFVQIRSAQGELTGEIKIAFADIGFLCFNYQDDYLNEQECSNYVNGESRNNLNIVYKKISN